MRVFTLMLKAVYDISYLQGADNSDGSGKTGKTGTGNT